MWYGPEGGRDVSTPRPCRAPQDGWAHETAVAYMLVLRLPSGFVRCPMSLQFGLLAALPAGSRRG